MEEIDGENIPIFNVIQHKAGSELPTTAEVNKLLQQFDVAERSKNYNGFSINFDFFIKGGEERRDLL